MKELMLDVLERIAYYTLKGLYALVIAVLIWIFVSYIQVISMNNSGNPHYCSWNFFCLEVWNEI